MISSQQRKLHLQLLTMEGATLPQRLASLDVCCTIRRRRCGTRAVHRNDAYGD
jgi:hypothetical protein